MKTKAIIFSVVAVVAAGCSSQKPKMGVENAGHEAVVGSLNNDSMPGWVEDAAERTFYKDGDEIVSIGTTTLEGNSRIDAGFRVAEANARANIGRVITNRMEAVTHIAEEGTDFSGVQLRSITAEATKLTASGMKPGHRHYQRVMVTGDDGIPRGELRFWQEIRMSENDYKAAIINAAKRGSTKPGLSQAFGRTVEKHFDTFVSSEGEGAKNGEGHSPASVEKEDQDEE